MSFPNFFKLLLSILLLSKLESCRPVIHSFTGTPKIITGNQKVNLNWDVKGSTSLQFNEYMSTDSVVLLGFRLTVKRGGKAITQTEIVERFKDTIVIVFETDRMEGEFVIAEGEHNNNKWGKFQIVSIENIAAREIIVSHCDRTGTIAANATPNLAFNGTTAGGTWIFKTRLTEAEKADPAKRPVELKIKAAIKRARTVADGCTSLMLHCQALILQILLLSAALL